MEETKIIVDSCCDMTPELKERMGIETIPLTLRLGAKEFTDDDSLCLPAFMTEMKESTARAGSASPAPYLYQQAMENAQDSYVVTLSSKLSGSYGSAMLAKAMLEEHSEKQVHIIDSKSASAGEVLIAVKIRELLTAGMAKQQLAEKINHFVSQMKTYFVLENYDNLQKNGRLSKVTETLIHMLRMKLVMGANAEGDIALFGKTRGVRHMVEYMVSMVEKSGKETNGENLVITHCNNVEIAEKLAAAVRERFRFKEILIVPTRGISSLYADDKGIVMAF